MDKTNMKEGILTRSDFGGYGYRRAELWTCPGTIMNTIIMQHILPIGQKFWRGNTLERLERVCISHLSRTQVGQNPKKCNFGLNPTFFLKFFERSSLKVAASRVKKKY